jgi:hypothetical protein
MKAIRYWFLAGLSVAYLLACNTSPAPAPDLVIPSAETETTDANLTTQALPSDMYNLSVGNPSLAGSADLVGSVYTVKGNGNGIGGTWDKHHFAYRKWVSDGKLQTRIASAVRGSTSNGMWGIMVRDSTNGNVAERMVALTYTPSGKLRFQYRSDSSTSATVVSEVSGISLPIHIKITRSNDGTRFNGSYSSNASTWSDLGTVDLTNISPTTNFGFAVNSGNDTTLDSVNFDNTVFEQLNLKAGVNYDLSKGAIPKEAWGINGFYSTDPSVTANATYNSHLTYMKPGFYRVHTWEMMKDTNDAQGWLIPGATTWDAWDSTKVLNALRGLTYKGGTIMINIPGWPAFMDANNDKFLDSNQFDNYAKFCARLVEIVNVQGKLGVKYWEVTNEYDDNYGGTSGSGGNVGRMGELVDIYNRAAKAMTAKDSTILTGGLAFERADLYTNVQDFINGTIGQGTLDFLSFHAYAQFEAGKSLESSYNRAYRPTNPYSGIPRHVVDLRKMLNAASPSKRIPLIHDEYNITANFRNDYPAMRTHQGATFDALLMYGAIVSGTDWTAAWNEKDGIFGKMDDAYNPRVTMGTFRLFNTYLTGTRFSCSLDHDVTVVCMATRSGSRSSVLLVNRSPRSQTVKFTFNNLPSSTTSFKRFEISAATTGYEPTSLSVSRSTLEGNGVVIPADSVTVITTP